MKSKKWNVQFEALNTTRALALHHQDILYPRLHAVTAAVVLAADSLRSSVAKNGLMTLKMEKHIELLMVLKTLRTLDVLLLMVMELI